MTRVLAFLSLLSVAMGLSTPIIPPEYQSAVLLNMSQSYPFFEMVGGGALAGFQILNGWFYYSWPLNKTRYDLTGPGALSGIHYDGKQNTLEEMAWPDVPTITRALCKRTHNPPNAGFYSLAGPHFFDGAQLVGAVQIKGKDCFKWVGIDPQDPKQQQRYTFYETVETRTPFLFQLPGLDYYYLTYQASLPPNFAFSLNACLNQ